MASVFDNPSDNVYDAYGKAVAAGQLFNDTLRRNTAFNALAKAYGPEVGDIKLATDAQQLQQAKTMDPLLTQQQTLQNAGLQQTNDFNAANNPALISNNQTVAATNANTLDRTKQLQQVQQVHGALTGALTTLGTSLNGVEDPSQRLALFDAQVDQLAPLLGAEPEALKHHLAQYRAAVATQGAAALPQIQQQLDASIEAGLTPEERQKLQIGATNLSIQDSKLAEQQAKTEAAVTGKGQTPAQQVAQQKLDIAQAKQSAADLAALTSFSDTVADIADQGGAIDKAIAFVQAHPDSYGLVAKGILGHGAVDVAGSNAYELSQILAPITSNVLLTKLAELKNTSKTGASGMGPLSDTEGNYLKTSSGSIDQGQSGNQLIANLMKLRDIMKRSRDHLTGAFKSAYGDTSAAAPAGGAQEYTYNPATGELE